MDQVRVSAAVVVDLEGRDAVGRRTNNEPQGLGSTGGVTFTHHFRQSPFSRKKDLPTEKGLLDGSKMVVVAREGRLLEAAALARPNGTSAGTVHSDNLSFRIELLDSHLVRMTWSKTETAAKAGVLERMEDLSVTHKVLEFGFGFTSQNLLAPSSLGLAHLKLVKACHVRLEGFRATFHLVGLHVG
jgi:hypothetical protein